MLWQTPFSRIWGKELGSLNVLTSLEGKGAINATASYHDVALSNIYFSPSFMPVLEIKAS